VVVGAAGTGAVAVAGAGVDDGAAGVDGGRTGAALAVAGVGAATVVEGGVAGAPEGPGCGTGIAGAPVACDVAVEAALVVVETDTPAALGDLVATAPAHAAAPKDTATTAVAILAAANIANSLFLARHRRCAGQGRYRLSCLQ
jgi:hypothetical protein